MKKPTKVYIEFDDGSVETHDTTDSGHYKVFNTHVEDSRIKGRIIEFFTCHSVGWTEGRISREELQKQQQEKA